MKFSQASSPSSVLKSAALFAALCLIAFPHTSTAQKRVIQDARSVSEAVPTGIAPTPIVFPGATVYCDHLNLQPDTSFGGAFTRIIDDDELVLDFAPNGNFQYRTYTSPQGPVSLWGNQPTPLKTVNLATVGNTLTSFNSQVPLLAVILRAGNDSYVFSYAYPSSPVTYSDVNLVTGSLQNVNRVNLCFGIAVAPSAATAVISGRVLDANGYGISGAVLSATDATSGATSTVRTNPFGYYSFDSLGVGQVYLVSVSHKRFQFSESTRTVSLTEDLASFDFVANP